MAVTIGLPLVAVVYETIAHDLSIGASASAFFIAAFWVGTSALLMVPLTLAGLFAYAAFVRRRPALERSYPGVVASLLVLGTLLGLVGGALSSWETLFDPALLRTFLSGTLEVAGQLVPGVIAGLILPRLLIPGLRPGVFIHDARPPVSGLTSEWT